MRSFFFVGIFVAIGVDQFHKYTDFVPIEARVSKVITTCKLYKKTDEARNDTPFMDCEKARRLANERQWQGATVIPKYEIIFSYISPVDNKIHEGRRKDPHEREAVPTTPGAAFRIRASKKLADETREL